MSAPRFVNGFRVKRPPYHAPRTAIANVSINKQELIEALQKEEGDWVYINILASKSSDAYYAAFSDWKPDPRRGERDSRKAAQQGATHHSAPPADGPNYEDDDIPF